MSKEKKEEVTPNTPYISIKQFLVTKSLRPELGAGFLAYTNGITMMRIADWEEKFGEYLNR